MARTLEQADSYQLFSLQPDLGEYPPPNFRGYQILGVVNVPDQAIRDRLNAPLLEKIKQIVPGTNWTALCFDPRHGIRVTRQGETFDFVICFECHTVKVYRGDAFVASFLIDSKFQPDFDAVLNQANVPLGK